MKDHDDYLKWSPKIIGLIHPRDMHQEEANQVQYIVGGMYPRIRSISVNIREDGII